MAVRHVKTWEGSKFYGLPIGAPITKDVEAAKRAEAALKGLTPPKGALSNKPLTPEEHAAATASHDAKVAVSKSTLSGPASFKVGSGTFSAPHGSVVFHKKDGSVAYVRTPDGHVHVFNEHGQVHPSPEVQAVIDAKFHRTFAGDAQYTAEHLGAAESAPSDLKSAVEGTLAKNSDGQTLFTKNADGKWENTDLGLEVSDGHLKALVDSGEITLEAPAAKAPEAPAAETAAQVKSFKSMSPQEFKAHLASMPVGGKIVLNFGSGEPLTMVREEDKKWRAEGKPGAQGMDSASLANFQSFAVDTPSPATLNKPDFATDTKTGGNDGNAAAHAGAAAAGAVSAGPGGVPGGVGSGPEGVAGHPDSAGHGDGSVLVAGHSVKVLTKVPDTKRTDALKKDGKTVPDLYEIDAKAEAGTFRDQMNALKSQGGFSAAVYVYDQADYAKMRLFLVDDGSAGIALKGDEIVSVFVMPDSKHKGAARSLVARMVDQGGTRLDAFDTVLPSLYAKEGFVPVARVKWDDEYAPSDWNKKTFADFNHGEPDVVFMRYDEKSVGKDYVPGSGAYVASYNEGVAVSQKPISENKNLDLPAPKPEEAVQGLKPPATEVQQIPGSTTRMVVPSGTKLGQPESFPTIHDQASPERPTPDSKPLANLKQSELLKALQLYPAGTALTDSKGTTLTKQSSGNAWHDENGKSVSALTFWSMRKDLTVAHLGSTEKKAAEVEPKKASPLTKKAAVSPSKPLAPEAPKEKVDPEKTLASGVGLDLPNWAEKADTGDKVWAKNGEFSLTKAEDGMWEKFNADGSYAGYHYSTSVPGMADFTAKEPKDSVAADTNPPKIEPTPLPAAAVLIKDNALLDDLPNGQSVYLKSPYSAAVMQAKKDGPNSWSVTYADGLVLSGFETHNLTGSGTQVYLPPFEAGQQFPATPETIDALPVGAKITVHNDGMEDATYTKVGQGQFMTKTGLVFSGQGLLNDKSATYSVAQMPAPETPKKSAEYAVGDKIQKYGHLRDLPVGSEIRASTVGYDTTKGWVARKQEDGWHQVKIDGSVFSSPIAPSELAENVMAGHLYLDKAVTTPQLSETASVQLLPGGKMYSPAQIGAAVDALEAHSGFQIAYGLKALDPSHPLADKSLQDSIKQAAMEAHPDMKPKPAFVAYLKEKAGLADAAAAEVAPMAGPKIHIGAEDPKVTSIQGLNGGDFSYAEIANAVDILENFQGKAFKAELNKKGNPLGALNPNEIVGFNKDKTITKANFLALLKKTLEENKNLGEEAHVVEEPKKPAPLEHLDLTDTYAGDTITDSHGSVWRRGSSDVWSVDGLSGAGWQKTDEQMQGMLTSGEAVSYTPGPLHPSKGTVPSAGMDPKGFKPGQHLYSASGFEWTKQPDGQWKSQINTLASDSEIMQGFEHGYYPHFNSGALLKKKDEPVHEPVPPTEEDLAQANIGSQVSTPKGEMATKIDSDTWVIEDPNFPVTVTSSVLAESKGLAWTHQATEQESSSLKTLLSADVPAAVADKSGGPKTVATAEIGDIVHSTSSDAYWTKTGPHTWTSSKTGGGASDEQIQQFIQDGNLAFPEASAPETKSAVTAAVGAQVISDKSAQSWVKKSDDTWISADGAKFSDTWIQSFLDANNAHWADSSTPSPAKEMTASSVPVGSKVHSDVNTQTYTKVDENKWESAVGGMIIEDEWIQGYLDEGTAHWDSSVGAPSVPLTPQGYKPGTYKTGPKAKAYMLVKPDGTGLFVNSKGDVTDLTPEKVKKNFEAGMQTYSDLPSSLPSTGKAPEKKILTAKNVESLADGTYFSGNPNAPTTVVYEVSGDKVTVKTPVKSLPDYSKGLGTKADQFWAQKAPVGAKVQYADSYGSKAGMVYTKGPDGWLKEDGTVDPVVTSDLAGYWAKDYKILSHGEAAVTEVPKAKVQTLFAKGKLIDSEGNSVVPKGYTGTVSVLGGETTVDNLAKVKQIIDTFKADPEAYATDKKQLLDKVKAAGLYLDNVSTKAAISKQFDGATPNDLTVEQFKEFLTGQIDPYLDGVTVEIGGDAKDMFHFDALGQATYPEALAAYSPYISSNSDLVAFIKEASASFGGGGIIGANYTKMPKWDKQQWVSYFKQGNFKGMYALEVTASAKAGKAHPAGWKHPGYDGNPDTNKITWGPAVPGEIAAGKEVPGEWTHASYYIKPSIEEVHNYLIKAQMQYPEYLSATEQRQWVANHMAGNKEAVDALSVLAKQRHDSNSSKLSDPLVWTDDIKPAKSYDILFEDNKFPTSWGHNQASEFWTDKAQSMPDLQAFYDAAKAADPYSSEAYWKMSALNNYYTSKQQEEYAKSLIPVYTKMPNQEVKKSTHPIYDYTDQWGGHYFFKPRQDTQLDKYRSEVEHLGNELGRMFGFNTAESKLITLDGQYGQLQKDVGGVTDLLGFDYSTLTAPQIADIGSEHVLDWFLDNDDTKGDNMKMLPDGRLVGIDKGRAFKHFGSWNGLSADSKMDTNCATVYNSLYSAIRSGKIDKETVDKAYLAVMRKAQKMAKVSDETITSMLEEGMKNRPSWDVAYTIDGKKVPQTKAGMFAAILDRKNRLPEQIGAMWEKIYKDAGYGTPPELPKNPLGDIHSGTDDTRWHENVHKVGASGATTLVSHAGVIGGSVLGWTEKDIDGTTTVKGKFYTTPKAQDSLLSYFSSHATNLKGEKAQVAGFAKYDTFGQTLVAAAKTVNHHAADGEYNKDKIAAFEEAKKQIQDDLAAWSPTLVANAKVDGMEGYKFPSGNIIPMHHVDQYKLMLDHYQPQTESITNSMGVQGKVTPHLTTFEAFPITSKAKYVQEGGDTTYTVLADGKALKSTAGSASPEVVSLTPDDITALKEHGFIDVFAEAEPEAGGGIVISKNSYTHEREAAYDPVTHTKTILPKNSFEVSGTKGSEYEAVLPTGEKVYFRNSGQTNTAKGQQGQVSFEIPNSATPESTQASMDRINSFLASIGMDLGQADDTSAELIYWHEMYGLLENRLLSGKNSEKLKKTYAKMEEKIKEYGLTSSKRHQFLDTLAEKMSPTEEAQYWRDLWSENYDSEVKAMLKTEGYLPKYDHQDWKNADVATGLPYWERFDVSPEDIYAQDFALVHSSGQSDISPILMSGALLGSEERIRQIGKIYTGGGYGASSPLQDQNNGSSHQVYTRVTSISNASGGSYDVILDPRLLLRTRTYGLSGDQYGNLSARKDDSNSNPLDLISRFKSTSNETMTPNMATLLDSIEIVSIPAPAIRDKIIQELKKAGIDKIRDVPVEDRIVLSSQMSSAVHKMQKIWAQKAAKK